MYFHVDLELCCVFGQSAYIDRVHLRIHLNVLMCIFLLQSAYDNDCN